MWSQEEAVCSLRNEEEGKTRGNTKASPGLQDDETGAEQPQSPLRARTHRGSTGALQLLTRPIFDQHQHLECCSGRATPYPSRV